MTAVASGWTLLSARTFYVTCGGSVIVFLLFFVYYYAGDMSRHHLVSNQTLTERGGYGPAKLVVASDSPSLEHSGSRVESYSWDAVGGALRLKNYMFPLRILEQLTMATAHFHQFQNIVNDWGFTGVEPFACRSVSTFYGLRSLCGASSDQNTDENAVPFSKLYNVSQHNDYLSKCMKRGADPETGHPLLFESITEFLRRSHRKIVLVHFAASKELNTVFQSDKTVSGKIEKELDKEKSLFTDCTSAARTHGMIRSIESLLEKEVELEKLYHNESILPLGDFKVTQAFCIRKSSDKISLRRLRDFVLSRIRSRDDNGRLDVSIIFTSWQGRFTHPLVDPEPKEYINVCRLQFSEPFHSDYVKKAAEKFLNSLDLHGRPYLSVHVRFEKLFLLAQSKRKSVETFVTCCMDRLNAVLTAVAGKLNITSKHNILLNWDYSPYGSKEYAWPINPKRTQEITKEQLKKVNARPVYFNPIDFDLPSEHSIVSLVEMDTLLNGQALVTVGEGSYQYTIVEMFTERHIDVGSPEAPHRLHYGHICNGIPDKEDLHGIATPHSCLDT